MLHPCKCNAGSGSIFWIPCPLYLDRSPMIDKKVQIFDLVTTTPFRISVTDVLGYDTFFTRVQLIHVELSIHKWYVLEQSPVRVHRISVVLSDVCGMCFVIVSHLTIYHVLSSSYSHSPNQSAKPHSDTENAGATAALSAVGSSVHWAVVAEQCTEGHSYIQWERALSIDRHTLALCDRALKPAALVQHNNTPVPKYPLSCPYCVRLRSVQTLQGNYFVHWIFIHWINAAYAWAWNSWPIVSLWCSMLEIEAAWE